MLGCPRQNKIREIWETPIFLDFDEFFLFSQDECFVLVLFANLDQNLVILGYFGYHHSQQTAISQIYKPSWHLIGHELQLVRCNECILRFTWILMVVQPTWLMECRMGSLNCVPLVEDAHGWWAQKYTSILYAYRNSTETGKDYCNDIIRQFLSDESDGFWLDQLDTVWIRRTRPT